MSGRGPLQDSAVLWRALMDRLKALEESPNADLLRGIIGTAVDLIEGHSDRRDVKMAHLALKESHRALEVFASYRHVPKISVFGSARTRPEEPEYQLAWNFGRAMVEQGFMVITGAGGGIMEAAQGGAGDRMSFGLNIDLPFEQHPNRYIDGDHKLINFKFFFTRKLFFLKETRALALFPGGFGTLDEGFEALTLIQTGKSTPMPIVLMEPPGSGYWEEWQSYLTGHLLARRLIHDDDLSLFTICNTVEQGVAEITRFFRVFHSAYHTATGVTIWLWRPLDPPELDRLNTQFADLMGKGRITQTGAVSNALSETATDELAMLEVPMDHRHQGRLRQLINAINNL